MLPPPVRQSLEDDAKTTLQRSAGTRGERPEKEKFEGPFPRGLRRKLAARILFSHVPRKSVRSILAAPTRPCGVARATKHRRGKKSAQNATAEKRKLAAPRGGARRRDIAEAAGWTCDRLDMGFGRRKDLNIVLRLKASRATPIRRLDGGRKGDEEIKTWLSTRWREKTAQLRILNAKSRSSQPTASCFSARYELYLKGAGGFIR